MLRLLDEFLFVDIEGGAEERAPCNEHSHTVERGRKVIRYVGGSWGSNLFARFWAWWGRSWLLSYIEVFLCIHYLPGYLYTSHRRYPATGSQLSCYASMDPFARRFTRYAMSRAQSLRIADSKNDSFDVLVYRDAMLFLLRSFQRW